MLQCLVAFWLAGVAIASSPGWSDPRAAATRELSRTSSTHSRFEAQHAPVISQWEAVLVDDAAVQLEIMLARIQARVSAPARQSVCLRKLSVTMYPRLRHRSSRHLQVRKRVC